VCTHTHVLIVDTFEKVCCDVCINPCRTNENEIGDQNFALNPYLLTCTNIHTHNLHIGCMEIYTVFSSVKQVTKKRVKEQKCSNPKRIQSVTRGISVTKLTQKTRFVKHSILINFIPKNFRLSIRLYYLRHKCWQCRILNQPLFLIKLEPRVLSHQSSRGEG
jgi:hypothetical protein